MLTWLAANLSTILIGGGLLAIVAAIIRLLRSDREKGILSCGGNCGACGACGGGCGGGCGSCSSGAPAQKKS